jgi:hypothetical protein
MRKYAQQLRYLLSCMLRMHTRDNIDEQRDDHYQLRMLGDESGKQRVAIAVGHS